MPVPREPESSDKWYHVRSASEKQKLRASPKEQEILVRATYLKLSEKKKNEKERTFLELHSKTLNLLNLLHYYCY